MSCAFDVVPVGLFLARRLRVLHFSSQLFDKLPLLSCYAPPNDHSPPTLFRLAKLSFAKLNLAKTATTSPILYEGFSASF